MSDTNLQALDTNLQILEEKLKLAHNEAVLINGNSSEASTLITSQLKNVGVALVRVDNPSVKEAIAKRFVIYFVIFLFFTIIG